jgi:hypothetical protein
MTDQHTGYIVILDKDLPEEDSAALITALGLIRGVISVQPLVADGADLVARAREFERWRDALVTIIQFGPQCVVNPRTINRGDPNP